MSRRIDTHEHLFDATGWARAIDETEKGAGTAAAGKVRVTNTVADRDRGQRLVRNLLRRFVGRIQLGLAYRYCCGERANEVWSATFGRAIKPAW